MERYKIKAEVREATGKGVARKLRREGLIPGVVYGRTREPQALTVDPAELQHKLYTNAIFDLTLLDGEQESQETVMIKEVQQDPIKGDLLHIDFQHISMDEKITVAVPLSLTGYAPGVKAGGILQQLMRELEVQCLPLNIPEEIEVDLSQLEIGESLLVRDLKVPEEIEVISPLEEVVVTIVTPTEEAEEDTEEEGFAEPEVIGEDEAGAGE